MLRSGLFSPIAFILFCSQLCGCGREVTYTVTAVNLSSTSIEIESISVTKSEPTTIVIRGQGGDSRSEKVIKFESSAVVNQIKPSNNFGVMTPERVGRAPVLASDLVNLPIRDSNAWHQFEMLAIEALYKEAKLNKQTEILDHKVCITDPSGEKVISDNSLNGIIESRTVKWSKINARSEPPVECSQVVPSDVQRFVMRAAEQTQTTPDEHWLAFKICPNILVYDTCLFLINKGSGEITSIRLGSQSTETKTIKSREPSEALVTIIAVPLFLPILLLTGGGGIGNIAGG